MNADAGLEQWLRSQPPLDLHLSVVSLGEILKGIELLPTGKKREKLRAWLDHDLRAQFAGRLLEVTSDVALVWGTLSALSVGLAVLAVVVAVAALYGLGGVF